MPTVGTLFHRVPHNATRLDVDAMAEVQRMPRSAAGLRTGPVMGPNDVALVAQDLIHTADSYFTLIKPSIMRSMNKLRRGE